MNEMDGHFTKAYYGFYNNISTVETFILVYFIFISKEDLNVSD